MVTPAARRLEESTFLLAANGSADAPPAAGLWGYLVPRARAVTAVFHPLNSDDPGEHRILEWRDGRQTSDRTLRRPSRLPYTYLLDAVSPVRRPKADAWFAFNNLAAVHGVARRRLGLAGKVAYWAVDFVPDRFGPSSHLTRAYDRVDALAAKSVDLRIELTEAARDGRAARLGLEAAAAPVCLAPIGLWLDRLPRTDEDGWRKRRVVYSGHLVPRQGVRMLVEAIALLPDVTLDIAGRGPQESELRERVTALGIADRVRFLGFFPDHRDVERAVADASVAVAPYSTEPGSFSRYADPSKIRLYTGVGLPVVTTPVPPSAPELEREAGVAVVPYEARAIADAISAILADPDDWSARRAAALAYSRDFDWGAIVGRVLDRLGFAT